MTAKPPLGQFGVYFAHITISLNINLISISQANADLFPEGIEWEPFSDLLSCFADLESDAVSPRYHFGEIRFTRLIFWSSILMHRLSFKTYGQYADHFSHFYAPLLFVFGVLTVVLSAMQVALATNVQTWSKFALFCR